MAFPVRDRKGHLVGSCSADERNLARAAHAAQDHVARATIAGLRMSSFQS